MLNRLRSMLRAPHVQSTAHINRHFYVRPNCIPNRRHKVNCRPDPLRCDDLWTFERIELKRVPTVRHYLRYQAIVVFRCHCAAHPSVGISRHGITDLPSEQIVYRHAKRFCLEVAKR